MSKYTELKAKHQAEVDAFPFGFVFNQKQFEEMMSKWGLTPDDTDKIYSIGGGGYVRKDDAKEMHEMFDRHESEMKAAMQDDKFLFDAFNYELANHEYCITQDIADAVNAVGIPVKEILANKRMLTILHLAIKAQEG